MRPIGLILLLLAVSPAAAAAEPPARQVRIADLDLTTGAGVAALDRRIGRAINLMCGAAAPADLDSQAAIQECRIASWKDASARRSTLVAAARAGDPNLALTTR